MKKIHLIYAACLLVGMGACAASVQKQVKDSSTTGSFPMLNRTSRNRHVLY